MVQRNPQDKEKPEPKIMVQGKTLQCVIKFKYLGGQLSNDATMRDEILGESSKHLLLSTNYIKGFWSRST